MFKIRIKFKKFYFIYKIDNQQLKENLSKLENIQDQQNKILNDKSEQMNNLLKGSFKMI